MKEFVTKIAQQIKKLQKKWLDIPSPHLPPHKSINEGLTALNRENSSNETLPNLGATDTRANLGTNAKVLHGRGKFLLRKGKLDQAITALRRANTLDTHNPEIVLTLGKALRDAQYTEEAVELYRVFLSYNVPIQVDYATALLDLGQVQDAIAALNPLPDLTPKTVGIYKVLGQAYEELGELSVAHGYYHQVLGISETADLHAKIGELLLCQGQIDDAIASFQRATAFSDIPGRIDARLALLLQRHQRYDEALTIYDQAIARSQNPAFWHCLKSMLYCEQGNLELSIDEFKVAVLQEPRTVPLWPYMLIERRIEVTEYQQKLTAVYQQHARAFEQLEPERSERILKRVKWEHASIKDLQIALTRLRRTPQPKSKSKSNSQPSNRPAVKRPPRNDFQGVFLEPVADSTALLVAFAGVAGQFYLPTFEFSSATELLTCSRLLLRDTLSLWYQAGIPEVGDSPDQVAEYIRSVANDLNIDRIVTIGNSAGGYAAILFGALLNAAEVHAFVPQTFLTSSQENRWNSRASGRPEQLPIDVKYGDVRSLLNNAEATQFHVYYSEKDQLDTYHAQRIANYSCVTLHPYREGGHGLIGQLRLSGELDRILMRAIAPDTPLIQTNSSN